MRSAEDIVAEYGIRLRSIRPGNQKTKCPRCNNRERSLSVKIDERGVMFNCHRAKCGWKGGRFYDDQPAGGRMASGQGDRSRDRLTYGDLHRRARAGWRAPA